MRTKRLLVVLKRGLNPIFKRAALASLLLNFWLLPQVVQGQLLVSTDGTPGLVVSYNPTTGAVTQNPFATPDRPFSISSDGTDVYITSYDPTNGSIGKYLPNGTVVNASLVTGLSGPYGIAVTGGEIYEVNQADQTVESFSAATGAANPGFTTIDIAGSSPSGIAVSGTSVYVVEQATGQVSLWNTAGTLITRNFIDRGGTTIATFGNDLYLTTGTGVAEYNATTGEAHSAYRSPKTGHSFM